MSLVFRDLDIPSEVSHVSEIQPSVRHARQHLHNAHGESKTDAVRERASTAFALAFATKRAWQHLDKHHYEVGNSTVEDLSSHGLGC